MEERQPYWQVAVRLLFSLLATAAFVIIGIRLIRFLMPFVIGSPRSPRRLSIGWRKDCGS